MPITLENALALEAIEEKLRAILPEQYRDNYEDVVPVSMGSAGLKFGEDGRVAWDTMWATYCDLAMAGGPPHRGTLLEPASQTHGLADAEKLQRVVEEICRGISMVTGLRAEPASLEAEVCTVRVECRDAGMAGWLVRAILMENVMARHEGEMLFLPAGPEYRLSKEIKNVITAAAKTCHYWTDHMAADQQQTIQTMVANASGNARFLEAASVRDAEDDPDGYRTVAAGICREITERTGSICFANRYTGWIGVECPDVRSAIWMMRAMVVENVAARREDSVLFLPVHPQFTSDDRTARLVHTFERVHRLHACTR